MNNKNKIVLMFLLFMVIVPLAGCGGSGGGGAVSGGGDAVVVASTEASTLVLDKAIPAGDSRCVNGGVEISSGSTTTETGSSIRKKWTALKSSATV